MGSELPFGPIEVLVLELKLAVAGCIILVEETHELPLTKYCASFFCTESDRDQLLCIWLPILVIPFYVENSMSEKGEINQLDSLEWTNLPLVRFSSFGKLGFLVHVSQVKEQCVGVIDLILVVCQPAK